MLRLKICDSHPTCKVANKCLNVCEQVEVVEWNKKWSPSLPLLSCESSVSVKENPDRKKKKHGHRKEKIKKIFFSYNIKTSEDKTERNLNEGRFGIKPILKKKKTNVLSTRRYTIYLSQIETLISDIWLLKLKFCIFCRFILLYKKVLLAINNLPE